MGDNSDDEIMCTPPELREVAKEALMSVLPEKSLERYNQVFESFVRWQEENNAVGNFGESVLLSYLKKLSKTQKPNTLWSKYSMIHKMASIKHKVDISKHNGVIAFLKANEKGYIPIKAKVFTDEEIRKFLIEAPDIIYLPMKVVTIFGILGCCRGIELRSILINHITDHGSLILVDIPKTKNNDPRSFTISNNHYDLVKKYKDLRPAKCSTNRFFINYQKGKCTQQPIGIHKFQKMPSEIASYLKLNEPHRYTGHSYRRSSSSIAANNGADMFTIQRLGGWRSEKVARGYVEDSLYFKKNTEKLITKNLQLPSTRPSTSKSVDESEEFDMFENNVLLEAVPQETLNYPHLSDVQNNNYNNEVFDVSSLPQIEIPSNQSRMNMNVSSSNNLFDASSLPQIEIPSNQSRMNTNVSSSNNLDFKNFSRLKNIKFYKCSGINIYFNN